MRSFLETDPRTIVLRTLSNRLTPGLGSNKIVTNYLMQNYEYSHSIKIKCVVVYLQFKDPLILLLLASASVSIFMQQFDDAISITVVSTSFICTAEHIRTFLWQIIIIIIIIIILFV